MFYLGKTISYEISMVEFLGPILSLCHPDLAMVAWCLSSPVGKPGTTGENRLHHGPDAVISSSTLIRYRIVVPFKEKKPYFFTEKKNQIQ